MGMRLRDRPAYRLWPGRLHPDGWDAQKPPHQATLPGEARPPPTYKGSPTSRGHEAVADQDRTLIYVHQDRQLFAGQAEAAVPLLEQGSSPSEAVLLLRGT